MNRIVGCLLLLVFSVGFVFAAGSSEQSSKAVEIVIYRGGLSETVNEDPVVQELNERLNVSLKFLTAPWADNATKINLILSSGEKVDIVTTVDDPPHWAAQGAIQSLDNYLSEEKTPYLYKLVNSSTFKPLKIDGKSFAIPQVTIGAAWGTLVRQDWLDKLGLAMPQDEEELFDVLSAFKAYGGGTGIQFEGANQIRRTSIPLMSIFGVPSSFWDQHVNFTIENGKVEHITTLPETKAALAYMNRLYKAGLINNDFPSMGSFPMLTEKYILSSKAGMGWVIGPYVQQAPKVAVGDPNAKISVLQPFSAKGYEFTKAQGIMVQSNVVLSATSSNPEKAIECLEYFNSYEGRQLLVAGVEGVHWTEFYEDGYFVRNEAAWAADYGQMAYHPLNFYLGQGNSEGYIPAKDYATFEEAQSHAIAFVPTSQKGTKNLQDEYAEGAKWLFAPNPFQFVQFPEENDLKNAITEALVVGWTKCIAAPEGTFEAEYNAYLAELERVGLSKWVALYQDYLNTNM